MNRNNKSVLNTKRYEYLVNARNFHYQNFNVWMVFFLAAIGGLFTGYYTLEKESQSLAFEKNAVLITGYIASLFWHWSCKGYYYWITNFMKLITDMEKQLYIHERVYSCFANKDVNNNYRNPVKGANISTSKIIGLFSYYIAIFWAVLFFHKLYDYCFMKNIIKEISSILCIPEKITALFFPVILAFIFTSIFNQFIKACNYLHSDTENHIDLKL